jgi:segregation and condensation protein A
MADKPHSLHIETEVFEGPFDLLLHLVRVSEMDIFDINISEITERYLAHLKQLESLNIEVGGEFLVMAATLLNIKSRTVLPENPHADEEEVEEGIPLTTEDLIRQLIEYRRFKEIAHNLGEREVERMRVFHREYRLKRPDSEDEDLEPQELDKLLSAFARVVQAVGIDRRHEIFEDEASVEDALVILRSTIRERGHCRLSDLVRGCRTPNQVIVLILALLEMTRIWEIRINQSAFYEDVLIEARTDQSLPEVLGPDEVTAERPMVPSPQLWKASPHTISPTDLFAKPPLTSPRPSPELGHLPFLQEPRSCPHPRPHPPTRWRS